MTNKKCEDWNLEEIIKELLGLRTHKKASKISIQKLQKEIKTMAKTIAELDAKIAEVNGKVNDTIAKEAAFEGATLAVENKQAGEIAALQAQVGAGADVQPQFDAIVALEGKVDGVNTKLDTAIAEQQVQLGS